MATLLPHWTADRAEDRASLEFVGTATTLLRLGPFTVLTDPNFLHRGQRAYLGHGLWSRRRTEPALGVAQLPPLDAVVLSHLHGDHWDRVAEGGLDRALPVLTTPPAAAALARRGFGGAVGIETWQTHELSRDGWTLRLTAAPGRHGPGPVDLLLPSVMGSVLDLEREGERSLRVYLTGDTLFRPFLRDVAGRFPGVDVAVLHLGGTRLLRTVLVTMDGEQGADLVDLIRPRTAVPVHNDDYGVFRSPVTDFLGAAAARGLLERVRTVEPGATLDLRQP